MKIKYIDNINLINNNHWIDLEDKTQIIIKHNQSEKVRYRLVAKQEKEYPLIKKIKRIFIATLSLVFTLGISLCSKKIRKLFTKQSYTTFLAVKENSFIDEGLRKFINDNQDHFVNKTFNKDVTYFRPHIFKLDAFKGKVFKVYESEKASLKYQNSKLAEKIVQEKSLNRISIPAFEIVELGEHTIIVEKEYQDVTYQLNQREKEFSEMPHEVLDQLITFISHTGCLNISFKTAALINQGNQLALFNLANFSNPFEALFGFRGEGIILYLNQKNMFYVASKYLELNNNVLRPALLSELCQEFTDSDVNTRIEMSRRRFLDKLKLDEFHSKRKIIRGYEEIKLDEVKSCTELKKNEKININHEYYTFGSILQCVIDAINVSIKQAENYETIKTKRHIYLDKDSLPTFFDVKFKGQSIVNTILDLLIKNECIYSKDFDSDFNSYHIQA